MNGQENAGQENPGQENPGEEKTGQEERFRGRERPTRDIPRSPFTRGARLASLPLGFAGRSAMRMGRRLIGQPVELITGELQRRTSQHLFRVLGELKGGAMKFGQMLSVFEAALPPEVIAPYRAALTMLQESAPALPVARVHAVLEAELGGELARAVHLLRRHPGGCRLHWSGAQGGVGGRPHGGGEDSVPRRR